MCSLLKMVILLFVAVFSLSSASFLDDIGTKETRQLCLFNSQCYTNDYKLDNYCCGVKCCNILEYISRDRFNLYKNFVLVFI